MFKRCMSPHDLDMAFKLSNMCALYGRRSIPLYTEMVDRVGPISA